LQSIALKRSLPLEADYVKEISSLKGANNRLENEMCALKLQNVYLSRWCLYINRPSAFVTQEVEHDLEYEQVSTLMSQEIDKLKIENKLLSDRNDHLEDKISKIQLNSSSNNHIAHFEIV
jgi:hypothetical protein